MIEFKTINVAKEDLKTMREALQFSKSTMKECTTDTAIHVIDNVIGVITGYLKLDEEGGDVND